MNKLKKLKAQLEEAQAKAKAKTDAEKAEKKRLAELQALVDAEEKRLNSKEYKTALKAIDDLAIEAKAQEQTIFEAVDALYSEIEAWDGILESRERLAVENRVRVGSERAIRGSILALKNSIEAWKNDKKSMDGIAANAEKLKQK